MLGGHLEDVRKPLPRGGERGPLTAALGGLHLPRRCAHLPGGSLHTVGGGLHTVEGGLHADR